MKFNIVSDTRFDFTWVYDEEPHASRRRKMLCEYPQMKTLFGPDPAFKWLSLCLLLFQLFSLPVISRFSWPLLLMTAYFLGGVINHSLMLAIHEVSHGMAFGPNRPMANKMFGILLNLAIPFPMSVTFKHYHLKHHKYQGNENLDTDIPTYAEVWLFNTVLGKIIWVLFQPVFYALRPLFLCPKSPSVLEVVNTVSQIAFDLIILFYIGLKPLMYLIFGCVISMGLHPVAGHFISEHYMFRRGYETYSYYGPLNMLTFNVGYHNEHHDFPFVSGCHLPLVRDIAPDYYTSIPYHCSWSAVIYEFIMDPSIGPHARIKRKLI